MAYFKPFGFVYFTHTLLLWQQQEISEPLFQESVVHIKNLKR